MSSNELSSRYCLLLKFYPLYIFAGPSLLRTHNETLTFLADKHSQRHNQWKGVLGRLDWEGHFPTSITNPQLMGKVGMCFHPDQDRILSVRECARTQVSLICWSFIFHLFVCVKYDIHIKPKSYNFKLLVEFVV